MHHLLEGSKRGSRENNSAQRDCEEMLKRMWLLTNSILLKKKKEKENLPERRRK